MGEPKARRGGTDTNKGRGVKRRRVSRACDQCRLARQKCDGNRPTCGACALSNVECTYAASLKRRGIQSGYIRSIELALSWCVFNVPSCEDSLKALLHSEYGKNLFMNSEGETAINLHQKWRNTTIWKGIDRLLSGETLDEPMIDEDDEDDDRHSPSETTMLDLYGLEDVQPTRNSAGEQLEIPSSAGDQLRLKFPSPVMEQVKFSSPEVERQILLRKLHLPDNFSQLVDIYFAYTHCWLPVVSKESILKLCYSFPTDGLELNSTTIGSGAYAELWSVLAIASFQIQYGNNSEHSTPPLAKQMMNFAQNLIPSDSAVFEKGHASSLLLLALINVGIDEFSSAWITVGRAIRITLLLRQKSGSLGLKALLLGCFVLETFLSVHLNTIPHLKQQDISGELLDEEGLDEWQPWMACQGFVAGDANPLLKKSAPMLSHSIFNQLVRLSFVLNDSITLLDTPFSIRPTTPEHSLLDWTRQMPAKIRGLYSISENEPTPHRLNLFLTYLVAKVICNPLNQHAAIDEALPVFGLYAETFGHAVIPPTFALIASIFQRNEDRDSLRRHRLNDIKSQVHMVWYDATPSISSGLQREQNNSTAHPITPQSISHSTSNTLQHQQQQSAATSLLHLSSPSLQGNLQSSTMPPLVAHPMEDFNPFSDSQTQFSLNIPAATPQSLYDGQPIEPYSSNSLMDLDALFDDLTSFDSGEHQSLQPAFVQNLGFASNANLTDLMTGGLGWSSSPS
jgi:Fungal Zn(2)-Cys(6) binuclear cluster domain/Fungal specific transcription factor domain